MEIGPGTGVLTQFLVPKTTALHLIEIDEESILFLQNTYTADQLNLIKGDFLKLDLTAVFGSDAFAIVGNFPYNISSQIVFKILENKTRIPFFAGMFQKEVAERICEPPGSKNTVFYLFFLNYITKLNIYLVSRQEFSIRLQK